MTVSAANVAAFQSCIENGGVAIFPTDTVYGLACDPNSAHAIARMYALKQRALDKPSAVMFFNLRSMFEGLPEIDGVTALVMRALLPGGVTFLVNRLSHRFPIAYGAGVTTLGVRVPEFVGPAEPLQEFRGAVLQSSANLAGGLDPARFEDIPASIRQSAELVLDAGRLHGQPSTVIDLTEFERTHKFTIVRAGAVSADEIETVIAHALRGA